LYVNIDQWKESQIPALMAVAKVGNKRPAKLLQRPASAKKRPASMKKPAAVKKAKEDEGEEAEEKEEEDAEEDEEVEPEEDEKEEPKGDDADEADVMISCHLTHARAGSIRAYIQGKFHPNGQKRLLGEWTEKREGDWNPLSLFLYLFDDLSIVRIKSELIWELHMH